MNKVVLALGVSLGALTLAACEAQQEPAETAETQTELAPAPVEAPPVVVDDTTQVEGATVMPEADAVSEADKPTEDEMAPAN